MLQAADQDSLAEALAEERSALAAEADGLGEDVATASAAMIGAAGKDGKTALALRQARRKKAQETLQALLSPIPRWT